VFEDSDLDGTIHLNDENDIIFEDDILPYLVVGSALRCRIFYIFLKIVFGRCHFCKYSQKFWHIFLELFCAGPAT
jgi:hypothetical protein